MSRTSDPALRAEWLGGEIAVVGLARSGRAVARLLARAGSEVYASDGGRSDALATAAAELERDHVAVDVGGHDLERIRRAALVVASPGVPPDAPPLRAAREASIDIVSEVEIALRFMPRLRYIGITGTNGKTTTTALVGQLLDALGVRAVTAGNIGTPLSEVALAPTLPDWAVIELSSFQLHDTPAIEPAVGVLTNLSPNHLDRYDGVESYYADKALLFHNASARSQWVSNADDPEVRRMVDGVAGAHFRFSATGTGDACVDREGRLSVFGQPLIARAEFPLLGDHNVANALAAVLAVAVADPAHRETEALEAMGDALRRAGAIEHRIEPAGERGGVRWINDSKSTNVASTLVALRGMTAPTILLLGGRHKGEPYTALTDELRRTVRQVIAYGEAAGQIEADLAGVVPIERLESSFEHVVTRAAELARPGDIVLLSPACSSYDMFSDYEHRGREFKRLVATPS